MGIFSYRSYERGNYRFPILDLIICDEELVWFHTNEEGFEQMVPSILTNEDVQLFTSGDIGGDNDIDLVYFTPSFSTEKLFVVDVTNLPSAVYLIKVVKMEKQCFSSGLQSFVKK